MGGLRVMHYTRVDSRRGDCSLSCGFYPCHPHFRLQELQFPASTSKTRPLPACSALPNPRLRSRRMQALAACSRPYTRRGTLVLYSGMRKDAKPYTLPSRFTLGSRRDHKSRLGNNAGLNPVPLTPLQPSLV